MVKSAKGGYYTKRPLWHWILIYLIVGGLIYFLIYYFLFAKKVGGYPSSGGYQNSSQSTQTSPYQY